MEQDILPDLLATIEQEFDQRTFGSAKLKKALQALKDKRATYIDVNEFAIEIGEILANVFKMNISAEILPDGKMYFNIADRLLKGTLSKNHELISNFAIDVQTELNHAAGYRIKGQSPGINQDKVDGLINKISDADDFTKVEWLLQEPIVNFSQSIVDDIIKANVDFHAKVGMQPRLSRRVDGHKPCKWCKSLAGTYDYPDVPDDVYRRHQRCKCTVEYNPKDGRGIQDSHSKVWNEPEREKKIAERKEIGVKKKEVVEAPTQEVTKEILNEKIVSENKKETKTEKMLRELAEMQAENKALKEALIQDYIRVRGMTLEEATNAANKITEKARIKSKRRSSTD